MTEQDATLSSSQRKKLKSSTFCGPGRSFPVPDCAHVTAARRLIGRANVSSATRARILACVSRKAKALGCGGDDSSDTEIETLINSPEFETTKEFLEWMELLEEEDSEDTEDSLKEKAANLIFDIRSRRCKLNHDKSLYLTRSLGSLLDTLVDELNNLKLDD